MENKTFKTKIINHAETSAGVGAEREGVMITETKKYVGRKVVSKYGNDIGIIIDYFKSNNKYMVEVAFDTYKQTYFTSELDIAYQINN